MRRLILLALAVAGLLGAMASTRWLTRPPELRTVNGADQFDAVRAKARLARVLGDEAPHPADSAASDGVRSRLLAELVAMGLSPRVDDRFACNNLHKSAGVSCARVRNIVVTVNANAGPHLLINSHYDSVPVGPGASDAGLGVAAMLEAAFLLKDRDLTRPVTFLFNEGEELGLVGARAFLDGDPLVGEVAELINLEARGTTGPVNMFETSIPNQAAVRLFEKSVDRPVANSLAVSAYRLIPNYTDVNSFAEDRRWLTLNFAPIGNETRYHSPGDDLAAVDLATLQHMGDQLVATSTTIARTTFTDGWEDGSETLFMNIGTRWLFTIEFGLVVALLVGAFGSFLLRRLLNRKRESLAPMLKAMPLLLAGLVGAMAFAWAGLSVVGALREGQFWRAAPRASELAVYAGVIASILAVLTIGRRMSVATLRRGWWLLFLLLGLLLTGAARGALVYFVLPPLIFALGAMLRHRWRHAETVAALLAAALLFVTLGGMLGLLQDLLNSGPLWIFALFGGLVLMPWLIELKPLVESNRWKRALPLALAFAALAWVPAALAPAYSADRQQQWTLQYVVERGRPPVWSIVNDRKPLPASFDRLGTWRQGRLEPLGRRQRWIAPAPVQPGFTQPDVAVAGVRADRNGRSITLRVRAHGADSITLAVKAKHGLRAGGFGGRMVSLTAAEAPYTISCTGRSCDNALATLVTGPGPLDVQVTATHWRLPPAAAPIQAARPAFARPQYLPDATILVRRIRV